MSPIAKHITLATNICWYSGTAEELIVNCISPLFLKSKATTGKEDNTNWHEITTGTFSDKYWKTIKTDISTLYYMGAWGIVEIDDNIYFVR